MGILLFAYLHGALAQEKSRVKAIRNEHRAFLETIHTGDPSAEWITKKARSIINRSRHIPELDSVHLTTYYPLFTAFKRQNQYDSLIKTQREYLARFDQDSSLLRKFPKLYIIGNNIFSYYWVERGAYQKSYQLTLKAIETIEPFLEEVDHILVYYLYLDLGYTQLSGMGDIEGAEKTFRKIIANPDVNIRMENLVNSALGDVYIYKDLNRAQAYYEKTTDYYQSLENQGLYYVNAMNIAEVHLKQGRIAEAEALLQKVLDFRLRDSTAINKLGRTYLFLSKVANLKKARDSEYEYLKKAEHLLEQENAKIRLRELYQAFVNYHKQDGNFEASFAYEKKAQAIRDSISDMNKTAAVAEMETKYKVAKKEEQIAFQKQLIQAQRRQKNWMILGGVLLFVALGTALYAFRQQIKTQKQLLDHREALNNEKLNTIIETHRIQSMEAYMDGQNKERERIARDLHDSISGNLAAIKLKLLKFAPKVKGLEKIVDSVDKTYKEVRTISHDLVPKEIVLQPFTDLLNHLITAQEVEEPKITIGFFPEAEINLLKEGFQTQIYRILQELIVNMQKHAKASKGTIHMTLHEDYLNILVEDDGIGFDHTHKTEGMGLRNVSKRIAELKGTLNIESHLGKGTTINIDLPL